MSVLKINTDGGARGNPGPAGIGVVFYDESEKELFAYKEYIGECTNNVAEYKAIIRALELLSQSRWIKDAKRGEGQVICRLDSQLVVEQLNGNYKVKQDHLIDLLGCVKNLLGEIDMKVSFMHVRREENKRADKLVNQALDEREKLK